MGMLGSKTFPENRGEVGLTETICTLRHLLYSRVLGILKSFYASL